MTPITSFTRLAIAVGTGVTLSLTVVAPTARAAETTQASAMAGSNMPVRGESGPAVVRLQQALIARGFVVAGGVTGVFTESTAQAVAAMQRQAGLRSTGKIDARTAKILGLAPTPTVTVASLPEFGAEGDVVWLIQAALQEQGIAGAGDPDGRFGVATRTAVTSFQKRKGLRASGVVDEATAIALGLLAAPQRVVVAASARPTATVATGTSSGLPSFGERSSSVSTLQQKLIAAGFAIEGGATGYFGTQTKGAVEAAQKRAGLPVTGIVDSRTMAAIGTSSTAAPAPAPSQEAPQTIPSLAAFPMQGKCWFGDTWHDPRGGGRVHEGTDLIGAKGLAVYAVANGVITKIYGNLALGGTALRLTAPDGTYYFYAHLDSFAPGIGVGVPVRAGQIIGFNGSTGNAHEPHLHFEIHPGGGAAVNPYPYLKAINGCGSTALLPQ